MVAGTQPGTPVIVVVHATSKQGSSVVASLLQTGRFRVKAITRSADSIKARQLAVKGAEVFEAAASDTVQLRAAIEGAYGVFAMTLSAAATGSPEERAQHEFEQGATDREPQVDIHSMSFPHLLGQHKAYRESLSIGKLQVDAAAAAGVAVFVFSTLENVYERTQGKWSVPHFTAKGRVEAYVKEAHASMLAVFLAPGFFYSNIVERFPSRVGENEALVIAMPFALDLVLPWADPMASMGPIAVAAFLEPEKYNGAFIPVYDEMLTSREILETLSQQTAAVVTAEEMPPALAPHWLSMAGYCKEFGYYAPERDIKLVRKIHPTPTTWASFLRTTGFDGSQSMADIRAKLGQ